MPTLMLSVFKDEPNAGDWLEGFDVFVIEMTPELAQAYLTAMDTVATTAAKLKLNGMDLYQFRCWDYSGQWFPGNDDAEPIVAGEYGDECQPPLAGAEPSRTECDIVLISEHSIEWTAQPKHADITVSTSSVSRKWLEQIAADSNNQIRRRDDQIEASVLRRLRDAACTKMDITKKLLEDIITDAGFTSGPETNT